MRFEIQQQRDSHWYTVEGLVEAETPFQAVEQGARARGYYRTRSVDTPDSRFDYFTVPTWGAPIPLDGRRRLS